MQRYDFYFTQPVSEAELDAAFTGAETAIWNLAKDRQVFGIISGFTPSAPGAWNLAIAAGKGLDKDGARLYSAGTITLDPRTDTLGASALPSGGHRRWVAVSAHFGRNPSDARVDGLGTPIGFNQAEALNPVGSSSPPYGVAANAGKLLVVQGGEDLIGSPLPARPALDASAILLCDVLITDGDAGLVMAAVDTSRAERLTESALWSLPSASEMNGGSDKFIQISAIPITATIYARLFSTPEGLSFTHNAAFDPISQKWYSDDVGFAATKLTLRSAGLFLYTRSDTTSNWIEYVGTIGWDGLIKLTNTTPNSTLTIPVDSDTIMHGGSQTVLWGLQDELTSAGSYTKGSMVTYPRTFDATPSSVVLSVLGTDVGSGSITVIVNASFPQGAFIGVAGSTATIARLYRTVVASYL